MSIEPVFVGANPGCVLSTGVRASVWIADWSIHGPGRVGIVATQDETVVVSHQPELARWLANELTAYFPEFEGVDLAQADYRDGEVEIETLTPTEVRARFQGFDVHIAGSKEMRPVTVDEWVMGAHTMRLTNLLSLSHHATIAKDCRRFEGEPLTAFVATSERWDRVRPRQPQA